MERTPTNSTDYPSDPHAKSLGLDNLLAGRTQESTFAEGVEQDQAKRGGRKGEFVANSSPSPVKRTPKCRAGDSSSQPAFLRLPERRLRTLLGLGGRTHESFE